MGIQSCTAITRQHQRSQLQGRLRARESLLRRAGGIDACPAERVELVALLRTRDCGVGIGGVAAAASNACDARIEIGDKKQAMKRYAERRCGSIDAVAFALRCEDRINDGRMAG